MNDTMTVKVTDALDYSGAYAPSDADLAEYAAWLASTDETGHAIDERCPDGLLDRDAPYGPSFPRYAIKAVPGGWVVFDNDAGRAVASCSWLSEATDLMDLLVAEDSELVTCDGEPWWAGMPTDPDTLDAEIGLPDTDAGLG